MAPELSSNWKKLQAQIQAESTRPQGVKRKAGDSTTPSDKKPVAKKQKVVSQVKKPLAHSTRPPPLKAGRKASMGSVQSKPTDEPASGVSASLALWAEDNDISTEDIAEAYGLGIKDNSMISATSIKPNEGRTKDLEVGKYIGIDCEMVGVGEKGYESALARVSIVDFHGRQVYDSYVRPKERVTDWRTHVSGISPRLMAFAREFDEVQAEIAGLMKGRILVGHDIRHELEVLKLDHPRKDVRDTARFAGFKKYGHGPKPSLRVLAREILGVEIQNGQHSSIEDARVAMLLFRKFKPAFDVTHANRYPEQTGQTSKPKPKSKKATRKNKR